MDRLPKKLEGYLLDIAEHEGEPGYLRAHLEGIPFDEAYFEMVLLEGLYDRKLLYPQGEPVEIWDPDDPSRGISFKPSFLLASEAKLYIEDLPKTKRLHRRSIVLSAITALGACAAIANLVLFIVWH